MRARLLVWVLAAAVAAAAAAAGARPELSTEFFLVPEVPRPATRAPPIPSPSPTPSPPPSPCPSAANCTAAAAHDGVLRRETWVVPLLVVCSVSALLMLGFEAFVVCKARQTAPSRRHLFLGQTLLLGLLLCAAVAAVVAATPTPAVCATIRMGAGVSYAVVFSALLVKCVFLISLNGGVYLPAAYQALLLGFAVLTQVAVGLQWLLASPPAAELRPLLHGGVERWVWSCRSPYVHLLASLSYCGVLLVAVSVLAVKSRAIRDNYREATFIGLSAGAAVLIAAAWLLAGLLLATPPQRDACLAFGLVATAAVVFLVMFMPKGRQLAAMGRDGLYAEDRDDRLSSLSRAASPSFFHFTPAHHPQPPAPAPHKAPVPPGLTDQAALSGPVASYARMLHYYPYCYYPRYACPCTPAPAPAPAPAPPIPNSGAGDHHHAGAPRWKSGLYLKPDDSNLYTTVEPTLSSNPNVFFQRSGLHPGLIY